MPRLVPASVRLVALLPLLAAASACATAGATGRRADGFDFARIADSIVNTAPLDRAHIGIEVYDPATGRTLYRHNNERRFVPASNQKLWPTSTALHELGPDWRYRTPILALGANAETGSAGALVVVGRGDPTWSSRFHSTRADSVADSLATGPMDSTRAARALQRDLAVLDSLADSVVARGIKHITGDLVIDASAFDDAIIPGAWTYGNLTGTNAPPTGAFVVSEGLMRVAIVPAATEGTPPTIAAMGPSRVVPVLNRAVTGRAGARRRTDENRGPWDDTVRVSGTIGVDAGPAYVQLAMTDPVRFAGEAFADALRARGVTIDGKLRIVRDSAEGVAVREGRLAPTQPAMPVTQLAVWTSPPMSEIVHAILAPSQNWIAEQLLRTLGLEKRGLGSWRNGIAVEQDFLHNIVGIDSAALRMQDGSGMSPQNLVTPHAVVQLYTYARSASWGEVFHAALARPNQPGTLSSRLRAIEGRFAGKTGTLTSVNALGGYVTTSDGRVLIVSLFSNASGLPSGPVVAGLDRLVETLANGVVPR